MSIAAAGIAAGASLLGTGASMVNTGKLNKKNRQWQEDMWNKTNEYNSPSQQMARFKEAGLNPHLIYGQGNSGNASMAAPPEQKATNYNFADAAMSYVATRKQQTEIDNLKKAQDVMEADIAQKAAQTVSLLSGSAKTDQERQQSSELFQTVKDTAEANLNNVNITGKKLEAEIASTLQNTKLSQDQQKLIVQNILESRARILNLKADNNLKGQEAELKKIEIGLRKAGINPNDPSWARILGRILDETGATDGAIKGLKSTGTLLERGTKWLWNNTPSLKDWFTK